MSGPVSNHVDKIVRFPLVLATTLWAFGLLGTHAGAADRGRLIVLADMGNEPDEVQQMLHLLICSNEIQLEGLLAVTGKHLRPEDKRVYRQTLHPELFHALIDGYEKVYPNLQRHAGGWHTPDYLRSIVASGQTGYGVGAIGDGKSSAGSQLIIDAVTRPDPRPVHLVMNAGSNTLAQALHDYGDTHTPEELNAFVAKLIVYENQAQDDAGAWICHEYPEIHWIRSRFQTRCYGGPGNTDLGPHQWKPFEYSPAGQHAWAEENIASDHGPLGDLYPERKIFSDQLHFIEGGGTIPWMRLVSHGLSDPGEPSSGGWSGRYTAEKVPNIPSPYADVASQEKKSIPFAVHTDFVGVKDRWITDFVGVKDRWINPDDGKVYHDVYAPIWRWRVAMWNDFKARMDWCIEPFSEANHHPLAVLNGDAGDAILKVSAQPGETITFDASGSSDPDRDALRYSWWIYPEAGRRPYGKVLPIENSKDPVITLTVPSDAVDKELHLILEVWDRSKIAPLVDYRREVIRVTESDEFAADE